MKNFSKQTVLKKVDKGHFMVRKIDGLVKANHCIFIEKKVDLRRINDKR